MRVKRLEIQGFKSFKDKTVIHFDHGITGIVGPNGCGKSNIVDAFFWVMGEQSYKHMRGSSSDDLIFNGSSKYSPLGLAEATLVLETDYVDTSKEPAGASAQDLPVHLRSKEVAVTRRLYRGGEGEYFINGVQARLKDIHELFMDTGVGAKGYSVIEQGQIGKVVNSKPEERRLLIEEAAGIAKYKARKKESLRKMEATQANLSRLNDVIAEIERSLNSLERQAQKARQYKKYKDELIDKEMTWGRRKTLVLRQKLESMRAQKDLLEQDMVALRAEFSTVESSTEADRIEQLTDTKIAEDLQIAIQQFSGDLTHEKSALDLSRRRQSDLVAQLQALESEKDDLAAAVESERERLVAMETEVSEADGVFRGIAERAQELDAEVRTLRQSADQFRRELEASKRALVQGMSQASDLSSRSAALAGRIESGRAQTERLTEQQYTHETRVTTLAEELETARTEAQQNREKLESLRAERQTEAATVQTREQECREKERARDEANRALTQVRSRLQSLEELAAAYEGFADGPRAALEWAKASDRKLTALAEAFDVSEGYENALEGWLENRLESLISDDAQFALEGIEHIRAGKTGRVAIQVCAGTPVAQLVDWQSVRAQLESAGFEVLGSLADFVRASAGLPATVEATANSMVSGVAIVRTLSSVPALVAAGGVAGLGGWSVVALDGSALDASGALRGGTTQSSSADGEASHSASVLKRKRAISELTDRVREAEAALEAAETALTEARRALETGRARMQALLAEIQAIEVQVAALDRDIHQMDRALREAQAQLASTASELESIQESVSTAISDRETVEAQLAELVAARAENETRIAAGDEELAGRDGAVRERETELSDLRVEEASRRERASSLKRELEAGRSLVADRERRIHEINRTLERATSEREQFSGGEATIEAKIEELTLELATRREQLALVKDRIEQSSARLNEARSREKELQKLIEEKSGISTTLAIDVERIAADLQNLVANLEEKYGPGCLDRPVTSPIQEEMSEPVVSAEMTAEEEQLLGEEVERLRERIRRLGEVNVGAIEEYEEVKKRFDHLANERADLERSIQNLQDAIEHINKTSEERFRKAFEAIADRFERLFPIIFGGGQARLSLVYPEGSTDILEAGCDILAQPPGKKVVNIGLLSGGEKALTAVSLIFAIFMVKPSPFCVLDEVDAPLDDANIGKFNALLREMSAKSQFILITHNKKTMELNDTLYGVTMEEPGVSKMVSIELQ